MRISLNWLNEYVNISDLKDEDVSAAFTDIGLEVEGMEKKSAFQGDVVVGKVLSAVKHPNADTLRCCKVDAGEAEPLDIVCGAPNAREGIKVVVAKVGSTLPGDFKIKKSKIRGETSCGMLCSAEELQIGKDADGIIELPESYPIGAPVAKLMGIEDTLLDLNVTPNRADCLGYIGLARDLSARLRRPLKALPHEPGARDKGLHSKTHVEVKITDPNACQRFVALYVKDVQVVPSPAWMQKRLEASGMRPINLVVDATNYAMLEFSQPVHAYDERDVRGKVIEVRDAKAGETLKTLDGQERKLEPGDILICDKQGPIGLAGVMGGENSEVKADTKNVIIEVATFSPSRVRKTSRRLALHTEASHRFERGVDVDRLEEVAYRVAELIRRPGEPLPVKIAAESVDVYPADVQKRVVAVRLSQAKQFLALPYLEKDELVRILKSLEFELLDSTDDRCLFEVPYFRGDIEREVDLIEEVGRIIGFDKIPYQLPVMSIKPTPEDPFVEFVDGAKVSFASLGFRETVSFPFFSDQEAQALGLKDGHPLAPSLTLANPLSEEHRHMQTTLIPGLVRAVAENRRRGVQGSRLFECGRGYFDAKIRGSLGDKFPSWKTLGRPGRHLARRAKQEQERPVERHWFAAVLDQPFAEKSWETPEVGAAFYHGKNAVLNFVRALGAGDPDFARPNPAEFPFLHPGASAVLSYQNKVLGYVGELHPRAAKVFDAVQGGAPIVLELDLEVLFDAKGKAQRQAVEPRRFPSSRRDVAFLAGKERTHADFEAQIAKFKRKQNLTKTRLFDVYEDDKLGAQGKKSMAYAFYFQNPERTLTDQEVDQEVGQLIAWLGETLEVTQR